MILFYCSIIFLVFLALFLLAIPFIKNKSLFSKSYFFIVLFVIFFTFPLYIILGEIKAPEKHAHYLLMVEVYRLGGIDGMISRIEKRLIDNPTDKKGWLILSKLYLAKNDQKRSEIALKRSQ